MENTYTKRRERERVNYARGKRGAKEPPSPSVDEPVGGAGSPGAASIAAAASHGGYVAGLCRSKSNVTIFATQGEVARAWNYRDQCVEAQPFVDVVSCCNSCASRKHPGYNHRILSPQQGTRHEESCCFLHVSF